MTTLSRLAEKKKEIVTLFQLGTS